MATSKIIDKQIDKNYNSIYELNALFPGLLDLLNKEYDLIINRTMQYKFHACNTVLLINDKNRGRFIIKIFNKHQRDGQFELEELVHNYLLQTKIIIPGIIRTKLDKLNSIYNGKKIVLYKFIIAREISDLDDINDITKKFAIFHQKLNESSNIRLLCNKYKLFNRDFGNINDCIFRKLLLFFSTTEYKIIFNIVNLYKDFQIDIDNSLIYGGLNKNHIAISDSHLVIYDSEGIGLGNKYLDIIYFAYYAGYRNNNEILNMNLILNVIKSYSEISNINHIKDINIYILYFFLYDLRIMLRQKEEFTDIQIKKHYLNTLQFYSKYLK